MSPLLLDTSLIVNELRAVRPNWTYREVGSGYRPGSGLGLSAVFHNAVLLAIVAFSGQTRSPPFKSPGRAVATPTEQSGVRALSADTGWWQPGERRNRWRVWRSRQDEHWSACQEPPWFRLSRTTATVSNPPRATFGTQTILQPSIENLPLLRRELPLPNILKAAPVPVARLDEKPLVVKAERLDVRANPEQPIDPPKITLPAGTESSVPRMSVAAPALPQRPVPHAPEVSDVHGAVLSPKGLLVLNAVPPPPQINTVIPKVEGRSLFAIASAEATIIADPAAGTKIGTASLSTPGDGDRNDIAKGDALAEESAGGGQ